MSKKVENEERIFFLIAKLEEEVKNLWEKLNIDQEKRWEDIDTFFDNILENSNLYPKLEIEEFGYPTPDEILERGGIEVQNAYVEYLKRLIGHYKGL